MKRLFLLLILLAFYSSQGSFMLGEEKNIIINNRILAVVNGKAISVMDVLKKMDVVFYRQYPEYRNNTQARYQFYQTSWKEVLQQLIDKELIAADAEEGKMELSNSDIRQEMESMFGPNILTNLDKINMTFDEAWNIVKDDILIRRMMYFRVHMKAMKQIGPQVVHEAYEDFAKSHIRSDEWRYQMISIRDANENGEAIAKYCHLLLEEGIECRQIPDVLEERGILPEHTKIDVSPEYAVTGEEISEAHKEILTELEPGDFSAPIAQKSRKDNSIIYRIFLLKEMRPGGLIPFHEVETALTNQLMDKIIVKETDEYLNRLRTHFGYREDYLKEMIPEGFQPVILN